MENLITIHNALTYTNLKWLSMWLSAFCALTRINLYAPFNVNMIMSSTYNLKLRQKYSIIKLQINSHFVVD